MGRHLLLLLVAFVAICAVNSVPTRVKRNPLLDANRFKKDVAVPYFFSADAASNDVGPLDTSTRRLVKEAMDFISMKTCIQFIRNSTAKSRIVFKQGSKGNCAVSVFGPDAAADTIITVVPTADCASRAQTIVRLIMLAMGFAPNSARSDLAAIMDVDAAIVNGTATDMQKLVVTPLKADAFLGAAGPKGTFEFGSILSFSPAEFTDDTRPIFKVKPDYALYGNTMGTGRVTFKDIKMINDNYCTACSGADIASCGIGYPNPGDCLECLCPEGYGGDCLLQPDGDADLKTEGVQLLASSTPQRRYIEFGQDPKLPAKKQYVDRVDWIKAPTGKKVEITLLSVPTDQCNLGCKFGGVEVKSVDRTLAGMRLCCSSHVGKPIVSALNPTPIISYNLKGWTNFWLQYRAV